ncbi:MAG: hypothetical protein FJX75_21620 [Armatimonadetes bacterium]|nr:hypothetical protein [Armatimonadota bacterium]
MRNASLPLSAPFACLALLACPSFAGAQLVGPPEDQPHVAVVKDFIGDFGEASQTNTLPAIVNPQARSDGVIVPAINLHPTANGDSIVAFRDVRLPQVAEGERLFLTFRMGMSDGINWQHEAKPNGVRFAVRVNREEQVAETLAELGWRSRALELTSLAGHSATIQFVTNAVDGNPAYDWALFAQPQIVRARLSRIVRLPAETIGIAFAEVNCTQPATVRLAIGEATERATLTRGRHWLPVRFTGVAEPKLEVASGATELVSCLGAPLSYRIELREVAASKPFLFAEEPFTFAATLENVGEGLYPGGDAVRLDAAVPPEWRRFLENRLGPRPIPPMRPGQKATVVWDDLSAEAPGNLVLGASLGRETQHVRLRAFPPPLIPPAARPKGAVCRAWPQPDLAGLVGNPWSRLTLVAPASGDAYAIAETWNGKAWQRVGSMYPLARLAVRDEQGQRRVPALAIDAVNSEAGALAIDAHFTAEGLPSQALRIRLTPEANTPRIRLDYEVPVATDMDLLAFIGPTVLAGDRAYGARKDFAIFPGLEYLEGAEESSSTRDLAPPLNDRRVPAAFRITTPLMAVQGEDSLVALLWDPHQEWAPHRRRPAARFLAPAPGPGAEYVHLSLLAPSVGSHLEENRAEATTPHHLKAGEVLRLSAQLVLDHKARYGPGSVASGPHRGGLVLEAMQQWCEAYGLRQPSPQPRSWQDERALSREAYVTTLWSEDPPGWPGHTAAPPGHGLDVAPGVLLDLAEGVPPDAERELRRRLDLVTERALRERAPNALLSSNRVELGFFLGHTAEALKALKGFAQSLLAGRENGLWVWRPADREHRTLGVPGTHTLGQAAYPSLICLRAARYTGDPDLATKALEAMRQMEPYEVPRGASMWECPQYQPDLLAAALAIQAYCEAYQLTGDPAHLAHARYWGWTGLPFIYLWDLPDRPTMLYNSIGVIGSTYYTHSWLGRPVVWMGLDYAYALQDLAEFDSSFPWLTVAQGITNSAMWQQHADGPSKGLYPDSWELSENHPNPLDLNPLLLLLNEYRLRGESMAIRSARTQTPQGPAVISSGADITKPRKSANGVTFELHGIPNLPTYTVIAPAAEPTSVMGTSDWTYDPELKAVILHHTMPDRPVRGSVSW